MLQADYGWLFARIARMPETRSSRLAHLPAGTYATSARASRQGLSCKGGRSHASDDYIYYELGGHRNRDHDSPRQYHDWVSHFSPVRLLGPHVVILPAYFLGAQWCVHMFLEARLAALRLDQDQHGRRLAWPRADWWRSLRPASYAKPGRRLLPWVWLSIILGAVTFLW